jgi:predicted dehydrogenase
MLEDTYAHSPIQKMFDKADVYGIGYDEERAQKTPLRLAIIGTGGVAQSKHIPAIMRLKTIWEPVTLAAVCVRTPLQGKKVAETYGVKWYADYKEMLEAERLDGVLVLSPDGVHYEHAMACMEKGIHVLVEKPITRSLKQSGELCRYADSRGLTLMTVSNKRYSPPYFRAKELALENPALFIAKFNLGYDYVDILEGGTIHIFDLARYFMGDVETVSAMGVRKYAFNKTSYPFDNATVNLRFTSGAVGNICTSATALSLKPWERVEIYAEKKWLAVEDQHTLIVNDDEQGPSKVWKPVFPNTLIFDEEFGGFMGLIENFLECIRGNARPLVTGWDGHRAYELALATHLSIRENSPVQLPLQEDI